MKLKPCPFCGGEPKVMSYIKPNWPPKYAVQCEYTGASKGCGAEGQHNKVRDLAISAWNQRVPAKRKKL